MTSNVKLILAVALGGGAFYFLAIRRDPVTGKTVAETLVSPQSANATLAQPQKLPGNVSSQGDARTPSPGTIAMGIVGASAPIVGALAAAGGGTAAAGAAAAGAATGGGGAAAGGIGLAAGVTIAGVAAGAALLVWGIVKKGLFRGGEEALKVNPARDAFIAQFARYDYMRDSRNPPGFYGLASVLEILQTGAGQSSGLYGELQRADTMRAYSAAEDKIIALLNNATAAQYEQAIRASRYAA